MKAKFGESENDRAAKAAMIRGLFIGGRTIAAHTDICMNAGVWTEAENAAAALREHRAEVRDALGAFTEDGMMWAGKTTEKEDGAPIWRQLNFWSYDDFVFNCEAYGKLSGENIVVHNRLADYCRKLFGHGPKRLVILETDEKND